MVVQTRDRDQLQRLLRRDEVWSAYALGDLDEPHFARTGWRLTEDESALVMTYASQRRTTVMTFGAAAGVASILQGLDLDGEIDLHVHEDHLQAVRPLFSGELKPHVRLAVDEAALRPPRRAAASMRPIATGDLDAILALYEEYPANCFEPERIDDGLYLGAFIDERLVAVGGTHVVAPARRIAAIGDLVTTAAMRGRGIGGALTFELCRRLLEQVDLIVLNVAASNAPARRLYDALGFGRAVPHYEGYGMRSARS